jgi:subtilisin-like proprotein convertase family protein
LECVASTLDATALPPDGLAVVSNGILTNVFPSIFASATAPKAVPDNDPFGILDDITVPDKGVVTALTVAVDISNSDTTGLKVTLLDPSNAPYVLYNGGVAGTSLKASYPDVQKPLSGDLGAWVGKNPKGKWRLQVVDTKAGPGGNDGQINAWSVSVKTLSSDTVQVKGDLVVDGGLSVGGKPMPQVWTAENLALAPGETLSIDTKLGEVPLAVSAWVKVGAEWKLITPNVPEMACPACGNGQDGDFNPNQAVTLVGGRWYNFRTFTLPAGVSLQASNGPLLIAVQGTAKIDGSIQVSGSAGPGGGGAGKKVSCVGDNCAVNVSCTLTGAGGGGFGTPGGDGSGNAPTGGQSYPPENTGLYKGGSGGGAGAYYCSGNFGGGGGGGGAIVLVAKVVSIGATGAIRADGGAGSCGILSSGGGGGAGGYVEIRADDLNIGGLLSAQGGAGGKCPQGNGGNGGDGVINVAANKVVGQSKPAYNAVPAVGLPASSAASFVVKTSAGSVKVNNDGGTSRAVRLVVLR